MDLLQPPKHTPLGRISTNRWDMVYACTFAQHNVNFDRFIKFSWWGRCLYLERELMVWRWRSWLCLWVYYHNSSLNPDILGAASKWVGRIHISWQISSAFSLNYAPSDSCVRGWTCQGNDWFFDAATFGAAFMAVLRYLSKTHPNCPMLYFGVSIPCSCPLSRPHCTGNLHECKRTWNIYDDFRFGLISGFLGFLLLSIRRLFFRMVTLWAWTFIWTHRAVMLEMNNYSNISLYDHHCVCSS